MATLTSSGRTALAIAIKDRDIHLAWGNGETWWDSNQAEVLAFNASDELTLQYGNVSSVVVTTTDAATTYTAGQDYSIDASTGVVTRLTGGAIASQQTVNIEYFVTRPVESATASSLANEVGRRTATQVEFCTPNNTSGSIVVPTGRFDVSSTPTNNLYMRFVYDFADGAGEIIREQAVYIDTEVDSSLPVGQMYFDDTDITVAGTLLVIQHSPAITRLNSTRETFEFVITL